MRAFVIALLTVSAAAAQGASDPPPLLQITRMPAGSRYARPYQSARAAVDVIGMASITGMPETWLVEAHLNFGSIEDLNMGLLAARPGGPAKQSGEAQAADDLPGAPRTMVAAYMSQYSRQPGEATRNLSKSRYFRVSIYRLKPGASDVMDILELQRRQEYNNANLDRPELTYRVVSGAPASTYLVLAPLTSLRQIDEGILKQPAYLEPMASTGKESEIGREHLLFRVDPDASYVSAAFAGADADFWKPRRQ